MNILGILSAVYFNNHIRLNMHTKFHLFQNHPLFFDTSVSIHFPPTLTARILTTPSESPR